MNLPTGTVTFLFTDIEGSAKLAQAYPDRWESMQARHHAILRHAIESQHGYVFRIIGDAFCAAFHSAADALRAALQSQLDLSAEEWNGPGIKVRMGVHTGRAEIEQDGEYHGYLTLTRVQRVMSVAHGGQILLSNAAAGLVRTELPEGVSLLDLGEHRLKSLETAEHLWQVVAPGIPRSFPPLQTLDRQAGNLPLQLTSFIGRETEIAAIRGALEDHHLVTLTGPGGIGKTRLSIETAARLEKEFPHGAWFVELASVADPALVPGAIASTLSVPETGGRGILDALKDYLREKQALLLLDNFEQVVDAAAQVKELLLYARNLKVIVTSREALRVAGEYEYRVPLLSLPEEGRLLTLEQLAQLGSVGLFMERARAARADFALGEDNAAAIAEICLRLDGLPLAIELAAARVRLLPPQKMLRQLDNRLQFLTSSARDLPARQRTLRAAIDWSYDLLTPPEKLLFQRLAVFVGGGTLESIADVCNLEGDLDLFAGLESLLDQSLLRQVEQDSEARYEMLGTIRDYASEALAASAEEAEIRRRHLAYFRLLAQSASQNLVGPDEVEWFLRLDAEHDNLRAAVRWGLANDLEKAVELIGDLSYFWSRGGHNDEVIAWLRQALGMLEATGDAVPSSSRLLRGRALACLGILALQQGYPEAEPTIRESASLLREVGDRTDLPVMLALLGYLGNLQAAEESIAIARAAGDRKILAYCLIWLSQSVRLAGGDLEVARRAAAEGAELSRQMQSHWSLARALFSQGQIAVALGEWTQARTHLEECLALFSQSQDEFHANMARSELAHVARRQGNYLEASSLYQSSIRVWEDLGLRAAVVPELESLASVAAAQGRQAEAVRLFGAAARLREQTRAQQAPNESSDHGDTFEMLQTNVEKQRFDAWLAEGRAMTSAEAIAYALALPGGSLDATP